MEELSECPICKGNAFSIKFSCIDYTVSRETFFLTECKDCHFVFTNPRPNANEIARYYQSEDYISHSGTKRGVVNSLYHLVRQFTIKKKFKKIKKFISKEASLLDIGCGTGEFLNYCKQQSWKTIGIEPSETGRESATKNYGLEVFLEEHLNQLQPSSFNVITLWHVLEHVHELRNRVKQIKNLLAKDGYAFIAVPNHLSYDAQYYENYWAAYDVPRHLYHFDKQSITNIFEQEKLELVTTLPMKMDAYYVSMLSEKYKYGKTNYLRAVLTGLQSNLKAGKKAEKYSSVIYIFKHI